MDMLLRNSQVLDIVHLLRIKIYSSIVALKECLDAFAVETTTHCLSASCAASHCVSLALKLRDT